METLRLVLTVSMLFIQITLVVVGVKTLVLLYNAFFTKKEREPFGPAFKAYIVKVIFMPKTFLEGIGRPWNDKPYSRGVVWAIFVAMIIAGSIYWIGRSFPENLTQIGSIFESSGWEEKYYVYAQRESSDTRYLVPATIRSEYTPGESDEDPDYIFGFERGRSGYVTYYIDTLFWPNGGYLCFEDTEVVPDEARSANDQNGEEWEITLTRDKAR